MGLAVDGANRHDMKLVRATVDSLSVPRPEPSPEHPQGMCLDKGYDFDEVRHTLEEFGFTAHIRSRGEEAKAIKREAGFKARRWVVERTHGWLNRFRRIGQLLHSPPRSRCLTCASMAKDQPSHLRTSYWSTAPGISARLGAHRGPRTLTRFLKGVPAGPKHTNGKLGSSCAARSQ